MIEINYILGKIDIIALDFCLGRLAFSYGWNSGLNIVRGASLGPEASLGLHAVNCSSGCFIRARFIRLLVSRRSFLRIVVSFAAIFQVSILSTLVSKSE